MLQQTGAAAARAKPGAKKNPGETELAISKKY
jgi:hypothetical protein